MLSGCVAHHDQAAPQVAQAKIPNIYVPPPPLDTNLPAMAAAAPPSDVTDVTDAKPAITEQVKTKKPKKRPPAPTTTAAATIQPVASTTAATPPQVQTDTPAPMAPPAATLGSLGATDPKQQQEVAARIAAVEKRMNDVSASVAAREAKQLAKVRLFLTEASDALKGGDVEGANILTTKAELLLDDLSK